MIKKKGVSNKKKMLKDKMRKGKRRKILAMIHFPLKVQIFVFTVKYINHRGLITVGHATLVLEYLIIIVRWQIIVQEKEITNFLFL